MNTSAQQSTVGFMKLVYHGGQRSHPDNRRTPVGDDQCSELVNLVQEITNEGKPSVIAESDFVVEILKAFGVTAREMENIKCRKRELVYARQLHIYVRMWFLKLKSAPAAAVYKKDRATALHCTKVIHNLMDTDKEYREVTEPIWNLWKRSNVPFHNELKT
jgi:hypothetical protein